MDLYGQVRLETLQGFMLPVLGFLVLVVATPLVIGTVRALLDIRALITRRFAEDGASPGYTVGDRVVYTMTKHSPHPSKRARELHPAAHGDDYSYVIDKLWRVTDVLAPDRIRAATRTGKTHDLSVHDPRLRRAHVWEVPTQFLRWRKTFPQEA
jgi:hypothetical protein